MTEQKRPSRISEKRLRRQKPEEKPAEKKPTYGYSIKLSSTTEPTSPATDQPKTHHPAAPTTSEIIPPQGKQPSPEELAKLKAEFIKKMQNDPNARQQMQQMAKEHLKKLPIKEKVLKLTAMFTMQNFQNIIVSSLKEIDNFINFVVKKHDDNRDEVIQKARSPILFGMWIIIITFCIFGVWAGIAPLDSASAGIGIVVVDSSRKIIQHKEGGIVEEILVKDGDHVKEGQILMKLSNAALKPQLDITINREIAYQAWLARLKAELNNSNQINFDSDLIGKIHDPEVNKIIQNQQALFESKKDALNGMLAGLDQRIEQHKQELIAKEAQKKSTQLQLKLINEQVIALTELYEKGFLQKSKLIELQSHEAQLTAAVSEIDSKIAQSNQAITELEIEKKNKVNQTLAEVNREARDVSEKLNETIETLKSIEDQFNRLDIKSPIDGTVSKIQVHTIGGIIHPGSIVMTIIPQDDNLVIDAFVKPNDIDSVYVGLKAKVRISAFKSRSTGPLDGVVTSVSPDLTEPSEHDKVYNMIFQQLQGPAYKVRIEVDTAQLKKISKYRDYELYPGMQAEVMIVTGERTLLQYLLDPVTSTFWHAFTEK